jgi:hypothetical protein
VDPLAGPVVGWTALRWAQRAWWWRRSGMVELSRGGKWRWTTRTAADAVKAAEVVARLVESGEWRPETDPVPPIPGAEVHYQA